ncbi:amino acid ABC transporter permease [Arsenicicoccus sp. oral taxon 190]|uniref:amino acid ABC transporter permease n=1 Tax=Arsenicicoccus sp. oral taxon 190 TaxID=1658671 RepID=UPI00067A205C|nr:amino acid ABC transporter permease [Arsenicicoccus sp. oral taxon 190]AKT51485.1 ABC transporter permease [Arsenicicoccus sp. oral taxon 190]
MAESVTQQHPDRDDRPGAIDARPVRHPWRWVAVAVIAVIFAMMISSFLTNPRWDLGYMLRVMNYKPVLNGLLMGTILGTIGAMILGVTLGVVLAVMRLSSNPVLTFTAALYTWFFRSIPRLVLLVMLGTGIGYLYPNLSLGVPFGEQLAKLLGLGTDLTVAHIDINAFSSTLWAGVIGLGLSEAAYMAEIARAGILSVDQGQTEAAQALGMPAGTTMRRVVLPQAMRVIVPPTGNETLAMVKDTSLLSAVPISAELFYQTQVIGQRTLQIMPTMMAAVCWYLVVCSILMVGQLYLERYFGRGFGTRSSKKDQQVKRLLGTTGSH